MTRGLAGETTSTDLTSPVCVYQGLSEKFASNAFLALDGYLQRNHYRGYEFDDLLGSPLIRRLTFNNLLLQRIAVQVGELCPLPIRPFLRIRKLESTKARGFIASAYLNYNLYKKTLKWFLAP